MSLNRNTHETYMKQGDVLTDGKASRGSKKPKSRTEYEHSVFEVALQDRTTQRITAKDVTCELRAWKGGSPRAQQAWGLIWWGKCCENSQPNVKCLGRVQPDIGSLTRQVSASTRSPRAVSSLPHSEDSGKNKGCGARQCLRLPAAW